MPVRGAALLGAAGQLRGSVGRAGFFYSSLRDPTLIGGPMPALTTVLGIDPSSTSPGWAIIQRGTLVAGSQWKPGARFLKTSSLQERMGAIAAFYREIPRESFEVVGIEATTTPMGNTGRRAARMFSMAVGIPIGIFSRYNVQLVDPEDWKGKLDKASMRSRVIDVYYSDAEHLSSWLQQHPSSRMTDFWDAVGIADYVGPQKVLTPRKKRRRWTSADLKGLTYDTVSKSKPLERPAPEDLVMDTFGLGHDEETRRDILSPRR